MQSKYVHICGCMWFLRPDKKMFCKLKGEEELGPNLTCKIRMLADRKNGRHLNIYEASFSSWISFSIPSLYFSLKK